MNSYTFHPKAHTQDPPMDGLFDTIAAAAASVGSGGVTHAALERLRHFPTRRTEVGRQQSAGRTAVAEEQAEARGRLPAPPAPDASGAAAPFATVRAGLELGGARLGLCVPPGATPPPKALRAAAAA